MKKILFLGGAFLATVLAVTAVCWPIGVVIGLEIAGAALGSLIGVSAISMPTVLITMISKNSVMINDYIGVLQVAILEATVWSKTESEELADSVSPVISKLSDLWARRKFGKSKLQVPSRPVLNSSRLSTEPPAGSVADLENMLVEAFGPLGNHPHLCTSRKIALL